MAATESTLLPILQDFPNATAKDLIELARITETAERFEDMCHIMGALVQQKSTANLELEVEERNMLSVAYKNVVGQRRASWRTLKSEDDCLTEHPELKAQYKKVVEDELSAKCNEVLGLLENNLIKELTDINMDQE